MVSGRIHALGTSGVEKDSAPENGSAAGTPESAALDYFAGAFAGAACGCEKARDEAAGSVKSGRAFSRNAKVVGTVKPAKPRLPGNSGIAAPGIVGTDGDSGADESPKEEIAPIKSASVRSEALAGAAAEAASDSAGIGGASLCGALAGN